MLINLVKKDFILAKKYWAFLIIIAIGIPIFVNYKITFKSGGFLGFFIMLLYLEYMIFSTVSALEDKYKGSALLCTTPYTRKALVQAKYLLLLVIFISAYFIYTIMTLISPISVERLTAFAFGISLLIICVLFGITIPLQYKFGFEKTRYIGFAAIFASSFIAPVIIKQLSLNSTNLKFIFSLPVAIENLSPSLLALIIIFISMNFSISIYSKKSL